MIWRIIGVLLLLGLMYAGHTLMPILPAPPAVLRALADMATTGDFWMNLLVSLARVFSGLVAAAAVAFFLSFVCYLSSPLRYLTEGVLGLLRPIPPIAWIPLSIVIFGLSEASSVFVIFIGAFFPIFSSSIQALTFEGRSALRLAQMVRGPATRHFFDVVIPASLPTIFTGLSVAIGFAWMVVVVAEMIAVKSGLGYQIQIERQLLRLDYVVAYMAVIGIVGALLATIAKGLQRALMPYLSMSGRPDGKTRAAQDDVRDGAAAPPAIDHGPSIHLSQVEVAYGKSPAVLREVDLTIRSGELLAIVGVSGSGKTTLLKLIAGQLAPAKGAIRLDPPPRADQAPGWVIQGHGLFEWMTVRENTAFGVSPQREKGFYPIETWLHLTGIHALADRFPGSLSGGQQQRVQIARALASRRELVLLDEPFSALDAITRQTLVPVIRSIFKRAGRTCVMVTHDLNDAIKFADRICVLASDGGRIGGTVVIDHSATSEPDEQMPTSVISHYLEEIWSVLERNQATVR